VAKIRYNKGAVWPVAPYMSIGLVLSPRKVLTQSMDAQPTSIFSSQNKILMGIILGISLFFTVVAFLLYSHYKTTLSENYDRFGTLVASVIATRSAEMLSANLSQELRIREFVNTMLSDSSDLAAIEFHDAQGNTLYENHKSLPTQELEKARVYTDKIETDTDGDKQYLGTVHIKLTGSTIEQISMVTRTMLFLVFLSAWLLTIIAVSTNTYILHKHLQRLLQGVKRLSSGDFGYRIPETDLWGELKTLAASFNDMSVRLRVYEDQNIDTITFERNKLQGVLMSIADGVIVCNSDDEIIIINDSACKHLDVDSSEFLIGRNIRDYVTVDGVHCFDPIIKEFHQFDLEQAAALEQGRVSKREAFIKQIEIPKKTLMLLISIIEDHDGDDLGFVMTTRDITREAEVDKLKTDFISNVSHELRTPVTTIKSYVDTVYNHGEELDKDTYKEFIETIHIETDRLKKMVNDILDFSRLEESGDELELQPQDISPIINLTVQSFKVLAQQKDITISTNIESNLPSVAINSDTVERVMRNLISNAIKYTDKGGRIKVRVELTETGNAVEVTVQDNGIGIAAEHLDKIFDRFYRVENAVHTVKGTGLGLHLVKTAIEKHHHGEVFVSSEPNVGSCFGFRLFLDPAVVHTDKLVHGSAKK